MIKRVGLVDADIFVYMAAVANRDTARFGGVEIVEERPLEEAVRQATDSIDTIAARLRLHRVILAFSCPRADGWRRALCPTYKAGRSSDPSQRGAVRAALESSYESYSADTLEGDDILGILSTHPTLIEGKKIIISGDKDLGTIPGWLVNPAKGIKPRLVTEHQATLMHMAQTLTGDRTDGYPGCPGIGPVGAQRILAAALAEGTPWANQRQLESLYWKHVVSAYEEKGLTENDAILQAQLARICRASDYDFEKKEVHLWTPPPRL